LLIINELCGNNNMKIKSIIKYLTTIGLTMPITLLAAEATAPSPTLSMLKMILGLVVVLAVMAAFAWGAKRFLPNAVNQNAVVKVLGGASVGTRERVVVLEIADRWIVVGVANGQVSAIANLESGASIPAVNESETVVNQTPKSLQPFANWLKQSMNKFTEK
jgi:flagellar protein FliO/FliZ